MAIQGKRFWTILSLSLLGLVSLTSCDMFSRKWSFVKDSALWRTLEAGGYRAERAVDQADRWDQNKIDTGVAFYVFNGSPPDGRSHLDRELVALAPETFPLLVEILNEELLREELVVLDEDLDYDNAPIIRICNLFDGRMPEEAIPLIRPFLESPEFSIRQACAAALAGCGAPEVLPDIRRVLLEDEGNHSKLFEALRLARRSRRLSKVVVDGICLDLEQMVIENLDSESNEDSQKLMEVMGLLNDLEPTRATRFLTSPEVLNTNVQNLHRVLYVLQDREIDVSRERVLEIIAELQTREVAEPDDMALGEAYHLLGTFRQRKDEELLRQQMESQNEAIADGAIDGLLAMHDQEDVIDSLFHRTYSETAEFTREEQLYLAVNRFDEEMNSGGFVQYFEITVDDDWYEFSGEAYLVGRDQWKDALDGLREMKLHEHAVLLEKGIALFGKDLPLADRSARWEAVQSIHADDLIKLTILYTDLEEDVELAQKRYLVNHLDKFDGSSK